MEKRAVAVVFGGASSEYEVSLHSAASVLGHLDREKYNLFQIGITRGGKMFLYTGPAARIPADEWEKSDCEPCVLSPDRGHHGLLRLGARAEAVRLDCVFPVLHGKNGEDGTIQGLLAMAGVPFVGCGCRASAVCMDKLTTHALLDAAGIPGTKWLGTTAYEYRSDKSGFAARAAAALGFPCFIKPSNAGSSVGITKAAGPADFAAAMELALRYDSRVIVEKMARGIELECAVLGNETPVVSCPGEIAPEGEFYDYNAKYINGSTKTYAPARIPAETAEAVRAMAARAYGVLGCEGMARVDFFLEPSGRILLNEVNTIPGFTSISMYPQLFLAGGLSYPALLDRLVELAMARA